MRVVHVVKSLLRNSGVGVFVAELASAQAKGDWRVSILCRWLPQCAASESVDYRTDPRLLIFRKLCHDVEENKIFHIHALWEIYTLRALRFCRRKKVPYVVSPHGCLMPRVFTRGRLKKWIFWHCFLKPLVKRAAAIHCTGGAEKTAVQQLLGKCCPPIVIAPLGVHMPKSREKPKSSVKTVLFLGRLGEEKGLVKLLEAWNQVKRKGWQLVLAGPDWEGHRQVLLDKCRALNLPYVLSGESEHSNIQTFKHSNILPILFPGAADATLKEVLFRKADIFVLPSPMENFSHTVVEALSYGVPVIATKGTPWNELESEHCGRWIDQGEAPLAEALLQLMAMDDEERAVLGANGRKLTAEKYQWNMIAEELLATYQSCIRKVG